MLTQKEVKKYLDYNADTGLFRWKHPTNISIKKGTIAGTLHSRGYIIIVINKKQYKAHRLAWLYTYGEFPKKEIDHINRIKDDNRIKNLRDISHSLNEINKYLRKDNISGYKGIWFNKKYKTWISYIDINKERIYLGSFKNMKKAIKIRKKYERRRQRLFTRNS